MVGTGSGGPREAQRLGFLILNFTVTGVGSTMPNGLVEVMTTLCLPYVYFFLNGEVHGVAAFLSTTHVNVDPATVEEKTILALRLVEVFLGFLVTVVSGAGHAAWVSFDCGQRSWVTSP
jgi:hypothetical protein